MYGVSCPGAGFLPLPMFGQALTRDRKDSCSRESYRGKRKQARGQGPGEPRRNVCLPSGGSAATVEQSSPEVLYCLLSNDNQLAEVT